MLRKRQPVFDCLGRRVKLELAPAAVDARPSVTGDERFFHYWPAIENRVRVVFFLPRQGGVVPDRCGFPNYKDLLCRSAIAE